MIEELIVKHCSPTLAGLKTGNMFSCPSYCERLLLAEIRKVVEQKNKVLITTLTKKMAEDLTNYFKEVGIRVKYLHSAVHKILCLFIIRTVNICFVHTAL